MTKLTTITAKVDALRAKGFSDEDIDALLNTPTAPLPHKDSPFNIGEIFDNGASAQEWNKQVDETEKLYINQNSYLFLSAGVAFILVILTVKGYLDLVTSWYLIAADILLCFLVMTYFMPKWREKAKFFVKKRP
ncbi:hypothetical protein [Photobacterium phosphoreum]|uniref:hypothetical protein n=1 Tax=Photobacterium phosphoreum TaxID=659 RepID=UPI001E553718|nr:hypothetical protein [Photobacterium phosphoreum]MCD9477137.1 hypothetical protein [Photobacterium phosphoreum]MCF2177986.1 hypothetical protein [Photobacterium phosphoreum]